MADLFVMPDYWEESEAFLIAGLEAVGLHFSSWAWVNRHPRTQGHISYKRDAMYVGRPHYARKVRRRLLDAGIRISCENPEHNDCTVIADYVRLNSTDEAAVLRARARRLVQRDQATCETCGVSHDLTVDHIVPISLGGGNDMANLRILCRSCNSRKGARI